MNTPWDHGWLLINKPPSIRSFAVVSAVRRLLGTRRVGHAGTLDAFAQGILAVAVGHATKTVSYLMATDKRYEFSIRWGEQTDTLDPTGTIVATSARFPTREEIEEQLPRLIGVIRQIPPLYSAVKVGGQRASDLTHSGAPPQLSAREVTIHSLTIKDHHREDRLTHFDLHCSKGTYVRSLARDLAHQLGTVAHVQTLCRDGLGQFTLNDTLMFDDLTPQLARTHLQPIEVALAHLPHITLTNPQAERLKMGQPLTYPTNNADVALAIGRSGRAIGLVCCQHGTIRPNRIFTSA